MALDVNTTPPHSIEAERAVLGAVLRDNEAMIKANELIQADDFYVEANQLIFTTMQKMTGQGEPIDLLTLGERLRQKGWLGGLGGATFLSQLIEATPTAGNVRYHAKIIKEKAVLRGVRFAALETLALVEEGQDSTEEVVAQVGELFTQATQPWVPDSLEGPHRVWESVPDVCHFLDDGLEGLSTGFTFLDNTLMGLRGLVLLGAGPGVGKSTFCLNVATHVARDIEGAAILHCDVENGRNLILLRLLSNLYGLTIEQLRGKRRLEGEMWRADLEEKLHGYHLVTDYSLIRPEIIERQVQQIGADKTLVVLDSLQKLPPLEKQRRDSIDRWLRELEQLKQDSSITVLLVSELSRGEGGINYKKPSLGSFKESGDIEYSADQALQYTETQAPGQIALHCVKNRLGMSGYIANYSYEQFKHWRWVEVPR